MSRWRIVGHDVATRQDRNRPIRDGRGLCPVALQRIYEGTYCGLPIPIPEQDLTRSFEESTMLPRSTKCVGTGRFSWRRGYPDRVLWRLFVVLNCCCLLPVGCSGQPSEPEPEPVVQLSEHEATLHVGQYLFLDLLPVLPPGYVPPVTWSSASPGIASVEPADSLTVLVRGLSPGQTVILVSGKGVSDSAMVVVSPAEPGPSATLLVTNATCSAGQCSAFQLLGLPIQQPTFPTPPGGWSEDLGTVTTESACLTLHAADTFKVIARGPTTNDTTLYIWTSHDPLALGVRDPDFWQHQLGPNTSGFVPASSAGWRVTLPGDTVVTPADPCG